MEPSEVLKRAWDAVQQANLPKEIHDVAFREAVRLIAPPVGSAVAGTANPRVGKPSGSGVNGGAGGATSSSDGSGGDGAISVAEAEIYDRVVAQTGVNRDLLERVVHLDNGVLKVAIPGLKLGKSNAERARTVAQILTITRSFGLEETETPLEIIRKECDRLRVYDQNNFSGHVKALVGFVVTGSGSNRRIRAKGPGIQAFPDLVARLVEGE